MAEASFLEVAQVILQDMSRGGNLPAGSIKRELDDLIELVSRASSSFRRYTGPDASYKTREMASNGEGLSRAILDMVEGSVNVSVNQHGHHDDVQMGRIPTISQFQQAAPQMRFSTGQSNAVPAVDDDTPQSQDVYLDNFHATGGTFDFELADLQWLDYEN